MTNEGNDEVQHRNEVYFAIERAIASGCLSYDEVLIAVGGADPHLVMELYNQIKSTNQETYHLNDKNIKLKKLIARRLSANLPLKLPAPNPMMSQWWFTLDSVSSLSERVWSLSRGNPVAFLGTPTVGYHYAYCYEYKTVILDADSQLIESLELPPSASKYFYDARDDLPSNLRDKFGVVLVDPPWYPPFVELFIGRAKSLLNNNGFILCVLPSRLTRPGLIKKRTELIKKLLDSNYEIVAIDSNFVQYRVPDFEDHAFKSIPDFTGRWWRRGDLLVLRADKNSKIELPVIKKDKFLVFTRNPQKLRFFMIEDKSDQNLSNIIEPVEGFDTSVSTRSFSKDEIAIWGSNKKGVKIKDTGICKKILELWAQGKTKMEIINLLTDIDDINSIIKLFDEYLEIWKNGDTAIRRRTTSQLNEIRIKTISNLASKPTGRFYPFQQDGFRLDFQRDRDRILWSHSLKRLANKTQLFPVKSDDQLRRRLTHTIEVMQIASTIAVAFGLDRFLTEAGALAHDLGHTPFGHAGEEVLNEILNEIDVKLGGFNHYEHGVDVVRWIENVYQSPGSDGFPGLNLTFETVECIFKHTYFRNTENRIAQSILSEHTKHSDLQNDQSCNLEGQAVRIADKISYLISDLEDGIRMKIIDLEDLLECRFFQRPPVDIIPSEGEDLYKRFISQRRAILKVMMEDILNTTDRKLTNISNIVGIGNEREYIVNNERDYVVSFSETLKSDIEEIWKKLQVDILFKNRAVMGEIARARKIVRELLLLYTAAPHLIDIRFKNAHDELKNSDYMKWYIDKVGETISISKSNLPYEHVIGMELKSKGDNYLVPTDDLILAKDYVASLTDTSALKEHRKYCGTLGE